LNFNTPSLNGNPNARVIKSREIKILKDGKFVHARQFSDSAHPEKNRNQIIKKNINAIIKKNIEDDR